MKIKIFLILLLAAGLRLTRLDWPNQYLFDEDMHAYTANLMAAGDARAYEWWHEPQAIEVEHLTWYYRQPAVEWLHPPVSKLLEAFSIKLFGNQPFAWRLPAALTGYALVIVLMLLVWHETRSGALVAVAGIVGATDRLFLVQSRLASTDIFVVFFMAMAMLWFWRWRQQPKLRTWLLMAVSIGLAGASKWSGWWLLPPLFISDLIMSKQKFPAVGRWLGLSAIAITVYALTFAQMWWQGKSIPYWIQLHQESLWYQQQANFDHPQASRPLEWLLAQKPVWYWYHENAQTNQIEEIKAQPSRAYLWLSELAIISWLGWKLILSKRKFTFDHKSVIFLCFLFSFVPWLFIQRPLFIYHFLPSYFFLLYLALILLKPLAKRSLQPLQKFKRANFLHHLTDQIFK